MDKRTAPLLPFLLLTCSSVWAEPSFGVNDLLTLSLTELTQLRVATVASGSVTPVAKAPGITYVITDTDIHTMGANTLTDALRGVPGLYIGRSDQALCPLFEFRGVTSPLNPQTLVMFNGLPLTSLVMGNRGIILRDWPVALIKRIEIIRGPGSALYGADAFAGVINIITKSYEDSESAEVGVRTGSFASKEAWVQTGTEINNWQISAGFDAGSTKGNDATVQTDRQTELDQLIHSHASLAPGKINADYHWAESRIDVRKDEWLLRLGYEGRRNVETGMGVVDALDPNGRFNSDYINADLSRTDTAPNWEITSILSFQSGNQENTRDDWLYPPGVQLPVGGQLNTFPNGLIGNPSYRERQYRGSITARYVGITHHRLLAGIGAFQGSVYDVEESKNFDARLNPLPSVENVINDPNLIWLPERSRRNDFILIQDEWQFASSWQLVTGVRHDYYSDFGDTTNPRIALIWANSDSFTTKLLYGQAFRAPSMQELFIKSNPKALGDPKLNPESMHSYELAFSYDPKGTNHLGLNLFHYRINDLIVDKTISNGQVQRANDGERTGNGFEIEWDDQLSNQLRTVANFSSQKAVNDLVHHDVGSAPNQQAYFRVEYKLAAKWQLTPEIIWYGNQKHEFGDVRPDVKAVAVANLALNYIGLAKGLELTGSIKNATDAHYATPIPVIDSGGLIEDTPEPRRSVWLTIGYRFR